MLQVAVVPPADVVAALEPFRRLHDPAFHRHPPYLALTQAFETSDGDALVRRLDRVRAASFVVTFDAPRAIGQALVLPARDEAGRIAAVLAALRDDVLPTSAKLAETPVVPALRIGLFTSDAERELARRSFEATVPAVPGFVATELTLLLEDARGLRHEMRRIALTPPGA